MQKHTDDLIAKITRTSEDFDRRMEVLEHRFAANYKVATVGARQAVGQWMLPFAFLFVALVLVSGFLYSRYRVLAKSHIL